MKIVAVCACPAGLMHTFMAAKGLKKEAKKRNYEIKVETQSASGIENEISQDEAVNADVVILAIDTAISGMDRFNDKHVIQVNTTEVLKNTKKIFDDAERKMEK